MPESPDALPDPTGQADHEVFELGDVVLQSGRTLRGARLAYKTYGRLNADKSNAIVYPTWYSGRHWENEWLIGPGRGLDPERWFIVVPNMLGNGLSSSPSNTPPPSCRPRRTCTSHPRTSSGPCSTCRTRSCGPSPVSGALRRRGANPVDVDVIDGAVKELLASPASD